MDNFGSGRRVRHSRGIASACRRASWMYKGVSDAGYSFPFEIHSLLSHWFRELAGMCGAIVVQGGLSSKQVLGQCNRLVVCAIFKLG